MPQTHTHTHTHTPAHTHTHTLLCNPTSGLIGNSQYHSSTSEEQDMKRILALPLAIHVGVGTSSWHDGPRSVPAGCQLSRRTQANPTPNLQQVRLHAHSPMVFVGSSMGERPGAPCLKMEQNESKAWTVNSVTNLGKQVFPTHALLCRVAMEAGKTPKKEKKRTTCHEKHLASGTLPPNLMRRTKGRAWPKVLLWWQAKGAERVKYLKK